ncbi:MAG: glycosyltransferase family 1 protein [Thermomicrobiales bacterium]
MTRIAFDATPAVVQQAGVGRYARELLAALLELPGDDQYLVVSAGGERDNAQLLSALPPGAWRELRRLPLNPRMTTLAWQRARLPLPIESLVGDFDVYHGTDFVVPPSRLPRVVTIHDLSFLIAPEFADPDLVRYLTNAVPRSLAAADIVVTVSASVAAEVADAYPTVRDKLVAVPNGVRLPADPSPRSPQIRPTILTVGTIEPRKNLSTLIRAMPIVRSDYPDAILQIAGRVGWRAADIVAEIRSAEAAGIVQFIETPDDARLETLYAGATLAVFPSWHEGFGLPVLESMARGLPVVASDIPSLRETGSDAAEYAAPGDVDSIAGAIVRFLDSAPLRDEYAARGIARAQRYTWRETARRTRRAYQLATGG